MLLLIRCWLFYCALLCVQYFFFKHLDGEERAGCFALFVFLLSHDCRVALSLLSSIV